MKIVLVKVSDTPGLGRLISESAHYCIVEYRQSHGWSYRLIVPSEDCENAGVIEIEQESAQ